jgi:hypothetical protein
VKIQFLVIAGLIAAVWIYSSSGSSSASEQKHLTQTVERQLAEVKNALDNGTMRNAAILKTYSDELKKAKPELTPLITNIEKDATPGNPALQSFEQRLEKVKSDPDSLGKTQDVLQELAQLKTATNPAIFNDSLTDSINVIADLSGGTLPRINAPPKDAEAGAVAEAGSQLVGNPHYGSWVQSNGSSVWQWFAAYAMFSHLTNRGYDYNNWAATRPWSYYNDRGRDAYGSMNERKAFSDVDARQRKTYGSAQGRRDSFYAKKTNPAFSSATNDRYANSSVSNQNSGYTTEARPRRSSSYSRPRSMGRRQR